MRANIHKNVTFPSGGIVCWNSFCNKNLLKRYHRQCLITVTGSLYAMQEYQQTPAEPSRKDNSRIYFFVIAIVALLATNIYFYVKYKTSDERVAILSDDKSRLEAEIDRQETALNQLTDDETILSESLKKDQDNARTLISDLRARLTANTLTRSAVEQAWEDIRKLRLLISKHGTDMGNLRRENLRIMQERDSLLDSEQKVRSQASSLKGRHKKIQQAMKVASALKISAFAINAVRARDQDREAIETRARRASKFKISFSIAENPLAKKGEYDIYMRVIDPNGNLIIAENKLFQVGREDLQYTYKTDIDFSDDGKLYSFDWTPEDGIKRGTYTFVLYTNGFLMGRASTTLR